MSGLKSVSGKQLIKTLEKHGYAVTRQKGSHIRLSKILDNKTHHVTVPEHSPLKIGTLHGILKEVAENFNITKAQLISLLGL